MTTDSVFAIFSGWRGRWLRLLAVVKLIVWLLRGLRLLILSGAGAEHIAGAGIFGR